MKSTSTTSAASSFRTARRGFTLFELLPAIGVICALIGLLLPAVQNMRDAAGKAACMSALHTIAGAEMKWRQSHSTYSTSLAELGLVDEFPSSERGGNTFMLVLPSDGSDNFRAYSTPTAPGKTGEADGSVDKADVVVLAPTPGAERARKQMFANIHAHAAPVLGELIGRIAPAELARLFPALHNPSSLVSAFTGMGGNARGAITIPQITNYNFGALADSIPELRGLIPFIAQEMELGAGGESVANMPGLTLAMLRRAHAGENQSMSVRMRAGISMEVTEGTTAAPIDAVTVTGFCDGSVRIGATPIRAFGGGFMADLQQAANNAALAGPMTLGTPGSGGSDGLLIALLIPPPVTTNAGLVPDATMVERPTLYKGIVIMPGGDGLFGGVSGLGVVELRWSGGLETTPLAEVSVVPLEIP